MNTLSLRGTLATVATLTLVWFAVAADTLEKTRGSGLVKSESRDVSAFTQVALAGTGDVHIERSDKDSLTIEAEDNILPLIETTVKDGKLTLTTKNRTSISPTRPIVYRITAKQLHAVSISGSGSMSVARVDAKEFGIAISGSGRVDASGKADTLKVAISGSGSTDASALPAASARIAVSGSGKVLVNAHETLDVSIVGSGSIHYLGTPRIQKRITGAGRVIPKTAQ